MWNLDRELSEILIINSTNNWLTRNVSTAMRFAFYIYLRNNIEFKYCAISMDYFRAANPKWRTVTEKQTAGDLIGVIKLTVITVPFICHYTIWQQPAIAKWRWLSVDVGGMMNECRWWRTRHEQPVRQIERPKYTTASWTRYYYLFYYPTDTPI